MDDLESGGKADFDQETMHHLHHRLVAHGCNFFRLFTAPGAPSSSLTCGDFSVNSKSFESGCHFCVPLSKDHSSARLNFSILSILHALQIAAYKPQ